jgi:hypothetical protein
VLRPGNRRSFDACALCLWPSPHLAETGCAANADQTGPPEQDFPGVWWCRYPLVLATGMQRGGGRCDLCSTATSLGAQASCNVPC